MESQADCQVTYPGTHRHTWTYITEEPAVPLPNLFPLWHQPRHQLVLFLKSLPAYFAPSNNFPKKPSNRQLGGGGEGAGAPEDPGRMLIRLPVGTGGGGLLQVLK